MKKMLLLGIVATTVAFTSTTARASDVGVRVHIGLPFPRILLPPPPRAIVVAPPAVCYPAPRQAHCAPPVVYHRCDYRCYHDQVHYGWDRRPDRYYHHGGRSHRGH